MPEPGDTTFRMMPFDSGHIYRPDFWLTVLVLLMTATIMFVATFSLFGDRTKAKSAESPASFFALREIAGKTYISGICASVAICLAIVYCFVCIYSVDFVEKLREAFTQQLEGSSDLGKSLAGAMAIIPSYFNPLFVLVALLVLFGSILRKAVEWFRDRVYTVLDVDDYADNLAGAAANALLAGSFGNLAEAQRLLTSAWKMRLPNPSELIDADDDTILTYQMIYVVSRVKGPEPFLQGMQKIAAPLDLPADIFDEYTERKPAFSITAILFYSVLCLFYWAIDPVVAALISPAGTQPVVLPLFGPVAWPKYDHAFELFLMVVQASLTFVLPLAAGMKVYTSTVEKTPQAFQKAICWAFCLAMLTGPTFEYIAWARIATADASAAGGGGTAFFAYFDAKRVVTMVIAALAPCLALWSWVRFGRLARTRRMALLVLCLTAAFGFAAATAFSEILRQRWLGFYWHQMLLGAYIAGAYFVAARVTGAWNPAPLQPQQPAPIPSPWRRTRQWAGGADI